MFTPCCTCKLECHLYSPIWMEAPQGKVSECSDFPRRAPALRPHRTAHNKYHLMIFLLHIHGARAPGTTVFTAALSWWVGSRKYGVLEKLSSLIRILVSRDGCYKTSEWLVHSEPCGPINGVWSRGNILHIQSAKAKAFITNNTRWPWSKHSCALVVSCQGCSPSRLKKSMFYGAITYSVYTQKAVLLSARSRLHLRFQARELYETEMLHKNTYYSGMFWDCSKRMGSISRCSRMIYTGFWALFHLKLPHRASYRLLHGPLLFSL